MSQKLSAENQAPKALIPTAIENLEFILKNLPEESHEFLERKFPDMFGSQWSIDIEWLKAILISMLNKRDVSLIRTLDDVTSISSDLSGSTRMREIVAEKTGDNEAIPKVIREATAQYMAPFYRIGNYFRHIQSPIKAGDGSFFIFKGGEEALESSIRAALEAGKEIRHANQNFRLLRKILKKDPNQYFSQDELEQLKLQLRVGIKTGKAIQEITDMENLNIILKNSYKSYARSEVTGESPDNAARLEVAGKKLIEMYPELRHQPVLIAVQPEDLEKLERKTGARFKTSQPETVFLKDKNWSSEVVLVIGYKASAKQIHFTKRAEITELEQILLNDLSVLQSGIEHWNQKAQELDFKDKQEGIEFFLLDEIFSFDLGQREFDALVQKGAVKIIDAEFGKRVLVSQEYYQKSLELIGKEIDRKHEWASKFYEAFAERVQKEKPIGFFEYRLLAREGFHLMHFDPYKAVEVIRKAVNKSANLGRFDLATTYGDIEEILRQQTSSDEINKRISTEDFLILNANRAGKRNLAGEIKNRRRSMISDIELADLRLKIRDNVSRLSEILHEQQNALEKGEEDVGVLESLVKEQEKLAEQITQLQGTQFSYEYYKYEKIKLTELRSTYLVLADSKKISLEKRKQYFYRALDSISILERLCLEDLKVNGEKEKIMTDVRGSMMIYAQIISFITNFEQENPSDFSGKTLSEISSEFEISEETSRIVQMNYEQKLRYKTSKYLRASKIAKKRNYLQDLRIIYSNIAYTYFDLENIEKSEKYLSLSEEVLSRIELSEENRRKIQERLNVLRQKIEDYKK